MNLVRKYFPEVEDKKLSLLQRFSAEFLTWNEKINCVSRNDIAHLEIRHILHSLSIARHFSFPEGSKILDLGTGGGFPGLPLAIYFPKADFVLVDSIRKKVSVVEDLIEKLGLENVTAKTARVEDLRGEFDYIVCRAVAKTSKIIDWIQENPNLKIIEDGRVFFLKGGDLGEELREAVKDFSLIPISNYLDIDFFAEKYLVDFEWRAVK
jgi:16S rRNA (guanine527-N7)-methyltransferase